jgi:dihydrolipoamide dehydrogenase
MQPGPVVPDRTKEDVMSERYDAVVIGAGPGGEVAVSRLADDGMRVALVEQELIGGECGYWACIPSKTLLSPLEARAHAGRSAGIALPEQRWEELAAWRDSMIRQLDDAKQVAGYRKQGVAVYKGTARIAGPGRVEVDGEALDTDRVVVATGSTPVIPPIPGLEEAGYWTNREATTLKQPPGSAIVLGGGPVGIELGQMLARLGARVTIVEAAERLLSREDERVSELIAETLRQDGVDVRTGTAVREVTIRDGVRTVTLDGGETLAADELIIAVGRRPDAGELGLETVGINPDARGGIPVDERCRAADGVWAIGDATGVMPFTHVAMYQGRIAAADITGQDAHADYGAIPRVVFCDPEVAAVGLTADQARDQAITVSSARVSLPETLARPWTYEPEPRGELGVLADASRQVLIGAWAVGPLASEWIHYAALAIKTATPLAVLRDTTAQFPTFCEGYLKAIEQLG